MSVQASGNGCVGEYGGLFLEPHGTSRTGHTPPDTRLGDCLAEDDGEPCLEPPGELLGEFLRDPRRDPPLRLTSQGELCLDECGDPPCSDPLLGELCRLVTPKEGEEVGGGAPWCDLAGERERVGELAREQAPPLCLEPWCLASSEVGPREEVVGGGWARRVGVVSEDVGREVVVGGAIDVLEAQAMDEPYTH